jgi:demethylmenaquinone methyltransferase/2-methoxy-6-polyprenyl-1,4-benzoquinol methylase
MKEITPYPEIDAPKKSLVAKMFNNIAPKYDFLNRFLSVGIDTMWRKKMLKKIPYHPQHMLDVATGTGDLVFLPINIWPLQKLLLLTLPTP